MAGNLWDKIKGKARDSARVGVLLAGGLAAAAGMTSSVSCVPGSYGNSAAGRLGGVLGLAYNLAEWQAENTKRQQQQAEATAQMLNEVARNNAIQYARVALPPFFIDTGWEDGSNPELGGLYNNCMEKCELKNLNASVLENGTVIYVRAFNYENIPARYRIEEYENNVLVLKSQEGVINAGWQVGWFIIRLERSGLKMSRFMFVGYLNDKEIGRKEVYVLEDRKSMSSSDR